MSATIYQFPATGRFVLNGREKSQPLANASSLRNANIVFGGAWYHEEAVKDAEPARKN